MLYCSGQGDEGVRGPEGNGVTMGGEAEGGTGPAQWGAR